MVKKRVLKKLNTILKENKFRNDSHLDTMKKLFNFVDDTEFVKNDNSMKPYLSDYETLFTIDNFYYTDKIEALDDDSLVQVVCSEIANVWQGIHQRKFINDAALTRINSVSLLVMHVCGIVKNKVRFAQSQRDDLISLYIKDHGSLDIKLVSPTISQIKYLSRLGLDNRLYNGKVGDDDRYIVFINKYKFSLTERSGITNSSGSAKYWDAYSIANFKMCENVNGKIKNSKHIPFDFVIKYLDELPILYVLKVGKFSVQEIEKLIEIPQMHKNEFVWDFIAQFQDLSIPFIEKWMGRLDNYRICASQVLSEEFAKKYPNYFLFSQAIEKTKFSEDFIIKNLKNLSQFFDFESLFLHQELSLNFINNYSNKVRRFSCLSKQKSLTQEFVLKHVDKFNVEDFDKMTHLDKDFINSLKVYASLKSKAT